MNVQNITDLHCEQHPTQQQHSTEHTAFQYVILFNMYFYKFVRAKK